MSQLSRITETWSRRVRVAGRLESSPNSSREFTMVLADGGSIVGVAEWLDGQEIAKLDGRLLVASGMALFDRSGTLIRVEVDHLGPASASDMTVWSKVPRSLKSKVDIHALRKPQGPDFGMAAIFAKWPGTESDEDVDDFLKEIS